MSTLHRRFSLFSYYGPYFLATSSILRNFYRISQEKSNGFKDQQNVMSTEIALVPHTKSFIQNRLAATFCPQAQNSIRMITHEQLAILEKQLELLDANAESSLHSYFPIQGSQQTQFRHKKFKLYKKTNDHVKSIVFHEEITHFS